MLGRKNQNILSKHYAKMVDHGDASNEEFITLKRADHDLPESKEQEYDAEDLSKRKLKLSRTKRMAAKYGQLGKKLVFDDDGNAHEMYKMVDPQEFYIHGMDSIKEAGRKFAEGEKGRLTSWTRKWPRRKRKRKGVSVRSARKG